MYEICNGIIGPIDLDSYLRSSKTIYRLSCSGSDGITYGKRDTLDILRYAPASSGYNSAFANRIKDSFTWSNAGNHVEILLCKYTNTVCNSVIIDTRIYHTKMNINILSQNVHVYLYFYVDKRCFPFFTLLNKLTVLKMWVRVRKIEILTCVLVVNIDHNILVVTVRSCYFLLYQHTGTSLRRLV